MVLCCCRAKKRKSRRPVEESSISLEESEVDGAENGAFANGACVDVPELSERPVKKSDLLRYIEDHQKDLGKYKAEFNALPGSGIKPFTVGRKHADKNRYVNIIPFDENRICLKECDPKSDYINASYIDGFNKPNAYIAAQGPMENTVNEFWQMIWEQKCSRIAMVTNVIEGEKIKCTKYWPSIDEKEEKSYGHIKVKTLKEEVNTDYVVRTLQVQHVKVEGIREIYQYHFTSWPDQDVPDTCVSILKFYELSFVSSEARPLTGPLLVHCSAGVGRTGTLIALDLLIQQVRKKEVVDIQKCVEKLRRQRVNMVQSTSQYIFLHHALLEYVVLGDVEIKKEEFLLTYQAMLRAEEKKSGNLEARRIQQQYSVLNALRPTFQPFHYSLAKFENNVPKNRSADIIPADNFIPRILPLETGMEPYINAVYVQGFRQPAAHIATQMPLPDTRDDFWNLVYADNSSAIVMLNDMPDTSEQYWPDDGKTIQSRDIEITNIGEIPTENIRVIDLRLYRKEKQEKSSKKSSKNRPKSNAEVAEISRESASENIYSKTLPLPSEKNGIRKVRLIRVLDWASDSAVPKAKTTLLDVHQEVERCREKNSEGRVVVHCLYGAERTGLFCALMDVLEKLKQDDIVDVFNSVKRVRRTRPEFISRQEQYKYLYELVSKCIRLDAEKVKPEPAVNNHVEQAEDDIYANASEQL